MKFNYRKIASVLASAVMVSSTAGFAAAANYPAPFVVSGNADGAVIVGGSAAVAPTDWAAAVDISTDLSGRTSADSSDTEVSGGDAKTLASGSDLVYLNDDLAENVATITDTDLSTVLADGKFVDDDGTEYEFEQTIAMGSSTSNGVAFSDSSNDLDNPQVILQITDSTTTPAFTLTVNFDTAVAFNATASEGEVLNLFGKEYTVGTATDGDTLVLLGGASETRVSVGEAITAEVGGESYEVSLAAISDSTTAAQASISINGDSKTFTEGQTKKVAGIDVYAKTVFRSGDNAGYVIVQLGSDKFTFETGSAVMTGSDNDDIEGTLVTFTGGVDALTKLEVAVSAKDSDEDHILKGGSFTDPVFGTVSLDFVDLKNAPELDTEDDVSTTRNTLAISKQGDRELGLSVTAPGYDAKTLPFVYQGELKDDNSNIIHVIEGTNMLDDSYFILNSGNYEHFMQLTKVSLSESSKSDVNFKDVITGETYNDLINNDEDLNESALSSTTFVINSQTYTAVSNGSTDAVSIRSSDYATNLAVFPYIELVDGKDIRFAMTDTVDINENVTTATLSSDNSKIYEVPTGNIQFNFTNTTLTSTANYRIDGGTWTAIAAAIDTYSIGQADYVIATTHDVNSSLYVHNVSLENTQSSTGDTFQSTPAILFVEEEDKTEATATTKNIVVLPTNDTGAYSLSNTPQFSGTAATEYDTDTFDDSDYVGYLTNFGTYVLRDGKDDNQMLSSLTYSTNGQQMYAEVFVSEVGSSITPGRSGAGGLIKVYKDNEVSSVSDKNLIVIGGSCINTVALKIVDSEATAPICGADFTDKTTVGPTQYILKSVTSPYNDAKIAMLVAGYEATDTLNAAAKLKEGVSTDVGEKVYPELTA